MGTYEVRDDDDDDTPGVVEIRSDRIILSWKLQPSGRDLVRVYPLSSVTDWGRSTHRLIRDDDVFVDITQHQTGFGRSYYFKIKDARPMLAELEAGKSGWR